ncbi:MAG: 2-hydroxychromene-2-carboxylate isomerase [Caulobacteraceae bacterium]
MPAPALDFIFDFGSPNAYLTWRVLPDLLERTGARLNLQACLLGGIFKATGNQSPVSAFAEVKGKLDYEMLETRRFIARHALIRYRFNPHFPVNSLLAMRGLVAAQEMELGDAYAEAVVAGFWERELAMADPVVVQGVLDEAGLPGAALLAKTQDPAVKARLIANTEAAVARGAFGVPTFFVGEEMFFGKERLGQVEEALAL